MVKALRQFTCGSKADFYGCAPVAKTTVSAQSAAGLVGISGATAVLANITTTFATTGASTPLFQKLAEGIVTLLNDAQAVCVTLATFALVICILGIFVASMLGPKATATMTGALKLVIGFFIFWQIVPLLLTTIVQVFGGNSFV